MIIKITTKQIRNKWHCSVTHNGYDVLENADTLPQAQRLMRNKMFIRGVHPTQLTFTTPIFYTYPERLPKPAITYNSCKIDNL